MASFQKKCELLSAVYALQFYKELESEEFISYHREYSLVLAACTAIIEEIVEATPSGETFINRAFEELAELFGMDTETLGQVDSIREILRNDN